VRRTLLLAALLVGCGGGEEAAPRQTSSVGPAAAAFATPAALPTAAQGVPVSPGVPWEDPEPPGAQALAESVVELPANRGKTTGLTMHITTLVDRRTGIQGFSTVVAGETRSLQDRLTGLRADVTETQVVIRLPGSVLFDFDSAQLRPDAERTLSEVVAVLAAYSGRPVSIEGHTDSIASDAYNLDLSKRRAEAVHKWLADHGMKGTAATVGHGEAEPVADNGTAPGRQLNRRVEIVIGKAG
jgi:outer membrane protein OmpA-like peptidoglycan-associated protein